MSARRNVLFAVLPTISACSLAFSLDGYEGPAKSSGNSPDGGASSSSGASGNPITTNPGSNADGGFCPTNALFCDDFERAATNITGNWGSFTQTGGTAKLVTGEPTGTAFEAQINAGASTGATVDLVKDFPTGAVKNSVTVSSKLFITTAASNSGMHFNKLVFTHSTVANSNVFPYLTVGNQIAIGELECTDDTAMGGCNYKQGATASIAPNQWHDIAFTVDFTASPTLLTLMLDGSVAIQEHSLSGATNGALEVQAAAAFVDGAEAGWDITIDNVVISSQ